MGAIALMGLILALIMILVGGQQGGKSFISLAVNITVMIVMIRLLSMGFPFVWVTLICGAIVMWGSIYFGMADAHAADIVLVSSIIVISIVGGITILFLSFAQVQGFGEENTSELEGMSLGIGIPFEKVSITMTIFSCLGGIIEAAVSVESGLGELERIKSPLDLQASGQRIGRQMLGTAFNTLFFGFFGSALALFIWFMRLNYSLGQFLNNKIFVGELLLTGLSAIGVVLVIPITVLLVGRWREKD